MAGQLYGTDIDGVSIADWLAAYTVPILNPIGYVEIWTSINAGYTSQTLLGTFSYVSGTVKIDRSNIIRRTATDIVILNDLDNDPGGNLLPIAGTDDGWFSPYGNEMRIYKGTNVPTSGTAASWLGSGPPAVPFTVVTGGSDNGVFIVPDLRPDYVFTVAPGTYTTIADLMTALNAAIGNITGNPFSDYGVFTYGFTSGCEWNTPGVEGNQFIEDTSSNSGIIQAWIGEGLLGPYSFTLTGGTDSVVATYAQLGVFLIDEVDINRDANGMIFSGTMSDRMEWLSRLSFQQAFTGGIVPGETVTDAIVEIITNAGTSWGYTMEPFPGLGAISDAELIDSPSPPAQYAIGDDPSKLATDLAAAYGCVLYFDCTGTIQLDLVPDPSSIVPCVEYLSNTSTSPYTISRAISNQQVPNVICVESSGTKANPPVTVWWWDSYPGSPTFYADAPAHWEDPQYTLPANAGTYSVLLQKFTTNIQQGAPDAAQAMALAIGLTSIGSLEKSTFTLRDQPAHDIDDVITVYNPIAGIPADTGMSQGPNSSADGFNYILDQVTIDLTAGGQGTQAVGRLVWAPPS
jgi:hypothetical protein